MPCMELYQIEIYLGKICGAFLKFWENPEIQDGGFKMAAIWQS